MEAQGRSRLLLLAAALVAAFAAASVASIASPGLRTAKKGHGDAKADRKLFNKLLKSAAPKLAVKHAKSADAASHATHADDANTVGGAQVKVLSFAKPSNTPETTLFDAASLKITASCPANNDDGPEINIHETSATQSGILQLHGHGSNPPTEIVVNHGLSHAFPDFDLDGGFDRGIVSFSWIRGDGKTVTGVVAWHDNVREQEDLCGVGGTLTVG